VLFSSEPSTVGEKRARSRVGVFGLVAAHIRQDVREKNSSPRDVVAAGALFIGALHRRGGHPAQVRDGAIVGGNVLRSWLGAYVPAPRRIMQDKTKRID
jgi:hypothetical protein